MGTVDLKKLLLGTSILLGSAAFAVSTPAIAQDDSDDVELIEETADEAEDSGDVVVVTGSRVRRDSFSSIAPLQVITADTIKAAGLVDTGEILKQQTVVTGVQLDTNVNNGFVTNGGPGASNVQLRGLGADRTLVLINGRRVAPSGVEGAPSLVDLNLIPSSMIARVETLLDGAGSVYGSDAVAGVINLILRDDFEGVRIEATGRRPFEEGGENGLLSFLAGGQTDRGNYLFSAEYAEQTSLVVGDRDFTRSDAGVHCSLDIEFNSATGETFRNCDGAVGNAEFRAFASPFATGAPFAGGFNRFFNDSTGPNPTLNEGNTALARSFPLDANDEIINSTKRLSTYFTSSQEIDLGDHTTNVFAEASYSRRQSDARNGFHGQLFPTVPGDNPFNILPGVPLVPVIFSPIERSNIDTEVSQTKVLLGLEGVIDRAPNWNYEVFGSYTRSQGFSSRPAVLEDRLALSLATTVQNPDGTFSCGNDLDDLFGFLTTTPCVPVNLFAPGLYQPGNAQFETPEQEAYLRGTRSATSFNEQTLIGGYITGPAFKAPAGDVSLVLGFEYREDGLDSRTDTIAATGGAAGFFADLPSKGSVELYELYAEAIIPIASGKKFAEDVNLELAGRLVDHEFFGTETVYSVKGNWAPFDWLNFRGTYGTSFRAPALRELFLGGQSGFVGGGNDPCIVPLGAQLDDDGDPTTPAVYDPTGDNRQAVVLTNCFSEGVDPTALGIGGSSSIEAFTAGNPGLKAETSEALTAGFTIDQPFTDRFDLSFGLNYFDVEVNDATANPGAGFILGQCYNSTNFPNDPFCQRRVRDPNTGFLTSIDTTPFNLGFFRSEGLDFNLQGSIDFQMGGRDWTFSGDSQITQQLASEFQNLSTSPVGDRVGDYGTPEWRSITNLRLETGPWTTFYRIQHVGEQTDLDPLTGLQDVRNPDGTFAETTGLSTGADTVVQDVDAYFNHTVSVRYQGDTWSVTGGLQNLFDEEPPQVDENTGATLGTFNVPLGNGYDVLGRTLFVNVVKEF